CPELAACTASMQRVRIVLIATFSMGARSLATVRPVFTDRPSTIFLAELSKMWLLTLVQSLTCLASFQRRRAGPRRIPVRASGRPGHAGNVHWKTTGHSWGHLLWLQYP